MTPTEDDSGTARERKSYGEILVSSAMIGATTAAGMVISIVRTKILAVILGPASLGFMGALELVLDLSRTISQMGVNSSAVKQIAEARGSGDLERVARTATVLRRTAVVSALAGTAALALLARQVSEFAFGTPEHADDIAWLSLALLPALIVGGQGAALQGMRRVRDLALMGLTSSALCTVATVALVYLYGQDGVVPALVASAIVSACVGWLFCRKIALPRVQVTAPEALSEVAALLRLGFAFLASALLMTGAALLARVFVTRHSGLDSAGLFQAAWTIAGLYVGIMLQAMGTDFYPRLVPAMARHDECNRLVNEQTCIAVLLAAPGVIATLTLAPLLIPLFYSSRFDGAIEILRWITLGMALRVVTWPIGFIVVASGRPRLFIGVELAWAVVNVGLSWILVVKYGAVGAGIAFALSYVWHGLLVYPIANRLTGFSWTMANRRLVSLYGALVVVVFLAGDYLSAWASSLFGVVVTLAAALYSLVAVSRLVPLHALPARVRWLLRISPSLSGRRSS